MIPALPTADIRFQGSSKTAYESLVRVGVGQYIDGPKRVNLRISPAQIWSEESCCRHEMKSVDAISGFMVSPCLVPSPTVEREPTTVLFIYIPIV